MQLEQSFTVPVPVEQAWEVLLDLPRVARCMPGATLTESDGETFAGNVKVKLGPISLTYQGKGRFVERDEAARRVVVEASGKDARSAGTAAATVTATLTGAGDTTTVDVVTDLKITGRPAQFGRGMIAEVSGKLLGQFADCLAETLGSAPAGAPASGAPASGAAASGSPAGGAAAAGAAASGSPAGGAEAAGAAAAPDEAPAAADAPVHADAPADGGASAQANTAAPAASVASVAEAEPVDLLRLTGSTRAARRAGWGVLGVVAVLGLAWLIIRWIVRS